eukprot:m.23255 g.23255  ORF g.23255 m.23255 type:complete len:453 (+) comp8470_c0_seq1:262-1620(+)
MPIVVLATLTQSSRCGFMCTRYYRICFFIPINSINSSSIMSSEVSVSSTLVNPILSHQLGATSQVQLSLDCTFPGTTQEVSSRTAMLLVDAMKSIFGLSPVLDVNQQLGDVGALAVVGTSQGHHLTVKVLVKGVATIDLCLQVPCSESHIMPSDVAVSKCEKAVTDVIQQTISAANASMTTKLYPAFVRTGRFDTCIPTADGLQIQYDFDELVFHEQSPYQDVKILHSQQFGNMLLLDNDPNLAESDLAYTHAIMKHGEVNYEGKSVLILGGGDGGILREVLKENPKDVVMLEIDQVVIDAAVKHLRGICGDAMDSLQGDNYQVLVTDCIPVLTKYIEEGRTFDVVLNDLTAIPVTTSPQGSNWDFLRLILNLSIGVMHADSHYITQGNGFNMQNALAMYEAQLAKLDTPVTFTTVRKRFLCNACIDLYIMFSNDFELTVRFTMLYFCGRYT